MVRAKFQVNSLEHYLYPKGAVKVNMNAVYKSAPGVSGNACEENRIFGDATPTGSISMMIQNPDAARKFEIGKFLYVDFTEAPE